MALNLVYLVRLLGEFCWTTGHLYDAILAAVCNDTQFSIF